MSKNKVWVTRDYSAQGTIKFWSAKPFLKRSWVFNGVEWWATDKATESVIINEVECLSVFGKVPELGEIFVHTRGE